ncbi:hypothetical protein EG328_006094 [Venturia inaequalis]|uniref:BTB domain-containing protein n=1 Tax=Venturia inaequalis TaxID=5025 RepID=A0A8H3UJE3_VENIN|nr:hypothetical protein EG328_006094 [Venturia inaequalis]
MAKNPLEALRAGLGEILQSGAYSDLIVQDKEGRVHKVHKAIVCAHSKFFQKACEPGKFKEGEESAISLIIGDSITISFLLEFLYTLDYGSHPIGGQTGAPLLVHVRLYIAADFYDIPKLKEVAATRFQYSLNDSSLTGNEFPSAVEDIYNNIPSSDRVLRDIALQFIMDNDSACLETLPDNSGLTITDVMVKVPDLGKELAMRVLAELNRLKPMKKAADRWNCQGFRKVQCQTPTCFHIWADARVIIPDGTPCPKCWVPKNDWDSYQVE